MFEKNMRLAYLLDFYGEVLDEHSRSIMTAYYEDDLSLAEIADGESISRQGVRHVIKKSEEQLDFLESRLGLAKRAQATNEACSLLAEISKSLAASGDDSLKAYAAEIESALAMILGK
jgi:predicted DNA-binding protein YlxM (UPF0122 family)